MIGSPVLIPGQAGDLFKVITLDSKSDLEDGEYLSMSNFTIGLSIASDDGLFRVIE